MSVSFNDMGLSPKILKAIGEMEFIEPSPIQALAIPAMMSGDDIVGQAQTGTGKTAAFGIPIIEKMNYHSKHIQALVLTPTRELAIQVSEEINKIARFHKGFTIVPIYGGQSIDRQIRTLRQGVQVVVGTPGRILDHLRRGTIHFGKVSIVVLDEADEMLDMGFLDDVREILSNLENPEKQTVMFSATMPGEILNIAKTFQNKPNFIKIVHKELTVPLVKQFYFEVRESDKPALLIRLIDFYNPKLSIVFVKTKVGVEELKEKIHAAGYSVEGLHGDMKQTQRDYVMKRFRNNDFDILIATDVAARGIDVYDITIVFNYDLPQDEEYYVHRIGRTARAGKDGMAISFVTGREIRKLKEIENFIKLRIERRNIPTLKDVESSRKDAFLTTVKETIETGELDKYINIISEDLYEFSSVEVAAALMSMMLEKKGGDGDSLAGTSSDDTVRFFITLGRKDDIGIKDLIDWIRERSGLRGQDLMDIALMEKFSFVSVPSSNSSHFLESVNGASFKGRKIHVELATKR